MPENNETVTLQPIPTWMKFGAPALVAIVLIVVVSFSMSDSDEPATTSLDGVEIGKDTPTFPELKEDKILPVDTLEKLEQVPVNIDTEAKPGAITENIDSELGLPFVSDKGETEKKLEQLQGKLDALETSNNDRQNKQDAVIKDLQAQLTSQQAQIEQLLDRLKPKKTKPRAVKHYKPRPVTIPFTLVSIDKWGSELYAVFRHNGRLKELTVGQTIDRWTVDDMNMALGSVTIKSPSGTRKVLLIQS